MYNPGIRGFQYGDVGIGVWVVTYPRKTSTLQDVCFKCNKCWDLTVQIQGGLNIRDIAGIFTNQSKATALARKLMQEVAGSNYDIYERR